VWKLALEPKFKACGRAKPNQIPSVRLGPSAPPIKKHLVTLGGGGLLLPPKKFFLSGSGGPGVQNFFPTGAGQGLGAVRPRSLLLVRRDVPMSAISYSVKPRAKSIGSDRDSLADGQLETRVRSTIASQGTLRRPDSVKPQSAIRRQIAARLAVIPGHFQGDPTTRKIDFQTQSNVPLVLAKNLVGKRTPPALTSIPGARSILKNSFCNFEIHFALFFPGSGLPAWPASRMIQAPENRFSNAKQFSSGTH
jgi:hypothetical protein